jgi:endonuclease/exonuclease/phosphatase family metal-dependent hydrolase
MMAFYNPLMKTEYHAFHAEGGIGARLRVLSYNIQLGIAYTRYHHYLTRSWRHVLPFHGRQSNLDSIAHFIDGFDIVALQEADAGSLRSDYINQVEYLARRAGFANWYAQTNRDLGQIAKHSLGLLSRPRPSEVIGYRLPGRIPGRGVMLARYTRDEHSLLIGVVHLSLGQKARRQQLAYLARQVARHEHVILMGDFNCRIDSGEFQGLLNSTHLCSPERELHTFPSWLPRRGVDHIVVTPSLTVEQTHVYELAYSDHLPIALDIRLPAALVLDATEPAPQLAALHG